MTGAAARILRVSLTALPILLPLLLCRRRLFTRFHAAHCQLLWLLLCLRLLIPLELPLSRPPVTVVLPDLVSALSVPNSAGLLPGHGLTAVPPEQAAAPFSLPEVLSLCWLLGTAAALCFHIGGYRLARRRLLSHAVPDSHAQTLAGTLGGTAPVLRGAVSTPITLGLLRPVILLPQSGDGDDLEMVLRHELCHIRRRDVWYKGLFLLCACVHWFNPLVWTLARAAGETVELCCDEDVVRGQDMDFRRRYGESLLHAAADHSGVVLSTCFGSSELKERLMNLFSVKKKGGLALCTLCCAALCLGSLVGCRVSAAPVSATPSESLAVPAPSEIPAQVPAPEAPTPETVWPVEEHYTLSAAYGERHHPITGEQHSHSGVDIPAEQGTLVLAAVDGTVSDCRFDSALGNCVELTHEDGCSTLYGCLLETFVQTGDCVLAGQVIGSVGATGQATGPHLHFEVHNQQGHHTDPLCEYPTRGFSVHHR